MFSLQLLDEIFTTTQKLKTIYSEIEKLALTESIPRGKFVAVFKLFNLCFFTSVIVARILNRTTSAVIHAKKNTLDVVMSRFHSF